MQKLFFSSIHSHLQNQFVSNVEKKNASFIDDNNDYICTAFF